MKKNNNKIKFKLNQIRDTNNEREGGGGGRNFLKEKEKSRRKVVRQETSKQIRFFQIVLCQKQSQKEKRGEEPVEREKEKREEVGPNQQSTLRFTPQLPSRTY